jgi:hypothetical protein
MKAIVLVAATAAMISAISPAMSQTKAQQTKAQQARESSGEANSQKQLGGLKRDRRISHAIARHGPNRLHHRQASSSSPS